MRCERCGGDFPKKQGRFCGTCPPAPKLAEVCADVLTEMLTSHWHTIGVGMAYAEDAIKRIEGARDGCAAYLRKGEE